MTLPDANTLAREWAALLPDRVRRHVHLTTAVVHSVYIAHTQQGWPLAELAAECERNLGHLSTVGGVVTHRLRNAATIPYKTATPPKFTQPKCDRCNPDRWLEDAETGAPTERCECAS